MRAELRRTERRYREGVDGIQYLPESCRFGVLLAAVLYAEHHRLIRNLGYDVLSTRPSLSTRRRIALLVRTWWHWRRTGDPRATFDAVSALPPEDEGSGDDREYDAAPPAGDGAGRGTWTCPVRGALGGLRSLIPLGGPK
jgi:phytoene synthase